MIWQRPGSQLVWLSAIFLGTCLSGVSAQQAVPEKSPATLVRAAVNNEVADARTSTDKHLFRSRKAGPHGSQTKLYVQTKEAMAAMLIANDDKPISPEQMKGEEAHLEGLVHNPDDLRRKQKQEREDADRTLRIVKALPDAFLYDFDGTVPSQPGIGKPGSELVRLKFRPNPRYSPPSRVEQVLAGMEGFLLIDKEGLRLAKIDAHLFRDVTFGWGILGHLDKGGSFAVCQAEVGDGTWQITHMQLEMTGKIMLFKSISIKSDEVLSDFRRVPDDTTFAQGVDLLKAEVAKMQSAGSQANARASRNTR